jgi:hypothetical protein
MEEEVEEETEDSNNNRTSIETIQHRINLRAINIRKEVAEIFPIIRIRMEVAEMFPIIRIRKEVAEIFPIIRIRMEAAAVKGLYEKIWLRYKFNTWFFALVLLKIV